MNHINHINHYTRKTLFAWTAGILLAVAGGLSSCDFLSIEDYVEKDLALDTIFTQKRYIEAFMWGAADYFPDEGAIVGSGLYTPGPMATDEGFCLFSSGEFNGMAYVIGELNESNLGNLNKWHTYYQVVRQCNTIFNRMDECRDWTYTDRERVIAYTKFFRAYAYYLLLMNHGPVVLLGDDVVPNNEDIAFYDRPRDLYDDCVEYICTEFEAAADGLPIDVNSVMEFGRPTKGAALALVARLRLQHASDLYNGGNSAKMYFGTWTRKTDGKHYIQQTADAKRWAVAAAAAKRVIDLKDNIGNAKYELHTVNVGDFSLKLSEKTDDPNYLDNFPSGAGGICPYHSYADMFNGETVMNVNKEFIWARYSAATTAYTRHSFPVANGGWNGMCVTQKVIDAYEMADGRPISNSSPEFPYSESGFTNQQQEPYFDYRLNSGVHNMYVNREPRFYASIGFSECFWPNRSTTEASHKNLTVTYYADSPNGREGASNPNDHPITGYVLKKFVSPNDAWSGAGAIRIIKPFPMIRFAEILLAYAEALNELESEYTVNVGDTPETFSRNTAEIRWAFNQVRYRAGLPGLTDKDLADANTVLEKIKRERMVEFLYENHRYFDVRRWGDYDTSESELIQGMNTAGYKDSYYQRIVPPSNRVAQRVVDRKMIFVPIPRDELKRLPSFDQNPGW